MGRTAKPTGRPVIPIAIEDATEDLIFFEDGRPPRSPVIMYFKEYDIGRMAAGYVCLQCKEDLDTAFPEECPICRYKMAARQAEDFAKEYRGNAHIGPSTTLEQEREIMNYLREKKARDTGHIWTPSIVVPELKGWH